VKKTRKPVLFYLSYIFGYMYVQGGPKKTKPHTFVHIFAKY